MAIEKKIINTFESVGFPDYGMSGVVAKVDTGAYTGALHCTKISLTETGNEAVLHFSPFDHPEITISTGEYKTDTVKSSNGERQKRYFIHTTITIQGVDYPIMLSLADRSEMKWPVLIGRKFLSRHKFLVDVNHASDIVTELK